MLFRSVGYQEYPPSTSHLKLVGFQEIVDKLPDVDIELLFVVAVYTGFPFRYELFHLYVRVTTSPALSTCSKHTSENETTPLVGVGVCVGVRVGVGEILSTTQLIV